MIHMLMGYFFPPGTVISQFLTRCCMEGVKKVHEMEKQLFQDGFIPERLHRASCEIEENNGETEAPGNSEANNLAQDSTHTSEPDQALKVQPFYGLIDLEKTMLQAISTLACDGSTLLDALVYFMVIPLSDIYMIR